MKTDVTENLQQLLEHLVQLGRGGRIYTMSFVALEIVDDPNAKSEIPGVRPRVVSFIPSDAGDKAFDLQVKGLAQLLKHTQARREFQCDRTPKGDPH